MNIELNAIRFNGCFEKSKCENVKTVPSGELIHETYLFRDHAILDFLQEYISKNFPNGTHIADFGCSDGEEAYSLAALLADKNTDLKYKITGYDISPEIVEKAKNGKFELKESDEALINENMYVNNFIYNYYKPEEGDVEIKKYQDIFEDHFDTKVRKFYDAYEYYVTSTVKPGVVKDSVNFKVADITDIGTNRLHIPKNTNVIIFKNAWYHLSPNLVRSTIENIHKTLPPKGILVVGTFSKDHTFDGRYPIDEFAFVKEIEKAGFKAIFRTSNKGDINQSAVRDNIPCIFQKI